jgi:hypothetical protein
MMNRLITFTSVLSVVLCLTLPANAGLQIIWVSDAFTPAGDAAGGGAVDPALVDSDTPWDQDWVDLLEAAGHTVDYQKGASPGDGYYRTLDEDKIAAMNAADLVIVSRDTRSGDYNNGDEKDQWNGITTPLILMNNYLARSSRWKWMDTTSLEGNGDAPLIDAAPPFGGLFQDLEALDGSVGTGNTSFIKSADVGNGMAIALVDDAFPDAAGGGIDGLAGSVWLAIWDEGVEFYDGAGQTAAGKRVYLAAGTREGTDEADVLWGAGMYNLTPAAEEIFLGLVEVIPEPATVALLGLGGLALLRIRKRA